MYNTFKPEQPVSLIDFVKAAKSCIRNVISLDGGFSEWAKAGKPVKTEARYV